MLFTEIQIAEYAFPLIAKTTTGTYRFMGTATVLGGTTQTVLTCAHIIEQLKCNEQLHLNIYGTSHLYPLDDFIIDDVMDLAYLRISTPLINTKITFNQIVASKQEVKPCQDITAIGYISPNPYSIPIELQAQVRKGYISWTSQVPPPKIGGITGNISSYPNPKGFSGGPVFWMNTEIFVGISYNNLVSEVVAYEHLEIYEDGSPKYKEIKSQIIENGVFHSIQDIQHFLKKNDLS
jgi:hypothetical protein